MKITGFTLYGISSSAVIVFIFISVIFNLFYELTVSICAIIIGLFPILSIGTLILCKNMEDVIFIIGTLDEYEKR